VALRLALCAAAIAALPWMVASAPAAGDAPNTVRIAIQDFKFTPGSLTVKAGSTVTWVNDDDEAHTVIGDAGSFRSSAFDTGETFSYRFDTPGTYRITCSLHPKMQGTVTVE
jgi:plastocyanin